MTTPRSRGTSSRSRQHRNRPRPRWTRRSSLPRSRQLRPGPAEPVAAEWADTTPVDTWAAAAPAEAEAAAPASAAPDEVAYAALVAAGAEPTWRSVPETEDRDWTGDPRGDEPVDVRADAADGRRGRSQPVGDARARVGYQVRSGTARGRCARRHGLVPAGRRGTPGHGLVAAAEPGPDTRRGADRVRCIDLGGRGARRGVSG